MQNKLRIKLAVLILLILVGILSYAFFGKMSNSQRAYASFRQFVGQENGVYITFIDDEWDDGIDAIGVVQKYIKPGEAYFDYYYRDTISFSWNHFYRCEDRFMLWQKYMAK